MSDNGHVTLTIDGKEATVPAGINVIEAAKQVGIEVPHYCYHPRLSVVGNCRVCLCEIEGVGQLQIGCNTLVRDGMVVNTTNERVSRMREGVMEFLLINHPLDCTICDQAGECKLQDYAVDHGSGITRFEFDKGKKPKNISWGDRVVFDAERCILCTRCVRFLDEIAGTDEISIDHRGEKSQLVVRGDGKLTSPYQMNIIDLCPVGALTSRDFRFKSRVWFMKFTPTIDTSDARGCNVVAGTRDNRMLRMVPRYNPNVNDYWMSDHGRLHYAFVNDEDRIVMPTAGGKPAPYPVALSRAQAVLEGARDEGILCVASSYMTNEELFALKGVCDALGVEDRYFLLPMGEGDDLLIHPEKAPNARGCRLAGFRDAPDDWSSQEFGALLYVKPRELIELPAEVIERCKKKVVFSLTKHASDVNIPLTTWVEKDGTMVSAGDRVQCVRQGMVYEPTLLTERVVLDRLHTLLDPAFKGASTAVLAFQRMADEHPALDGLTWLSVGLLGAKLNKAEALA